MKYAILLVMAFFLGVTTFAVVGPTPNLIVKNTQGEQSNFVIVKDPSGADIVLSSGAKLYTGAAAPSVSAPAGSLYLRSTPPDASHLIYVNSALGNNWAAITVP